MTIKNAVHFVLGEERGEHKVRERMNGSCTVKKKENKKMTFMNTT